MKYLATRHTTRRSHTARRYGAAFGAPALGLALAALAASPAAADCSAGPMTVRGAPGAPSYTCTRNCVATGGVRVIREVVFGPTATLDQCLSECNATLGCTQVSYVTTVEMRDGVPLVRMTCTLLGAGEPTTADRPPVLGRNTGVCHRDPPSGLLRDALLQIDTRILKHDQIRPGLPGLGVPYVNPKKP